MGGYGKGLVLWILDSGKEPSQWFEVEPSLFSFKPAFSTTQFDIECRFGGHSVTKMFKTTWQILLAKPKLCKKNFL